MKVLSCTILALLAIGCVASAQSIRWSLLNYTIRHKFPDAAQIEPAELDAWLHDPHRKPPLLIDVRTPAEFEVSHLQGARRIDPGLPASALEVSKDTAIVAYCSVGYRSSAFVEALKKAGFKNAYDLKGSIFQWVNEGRPVFKDGHVTDKVHPYDSSWGALLDQKYRADVPAISK